LPGPLEARLMRPNKAFVLPGRRESATGNSEEPSKDAIHWESAGKFFEDATGRPINECGQLFRLGGRDVFTGIHPLTKDATT